MKGAVMLVKKFELSNLGVTQAFLNPKRYHFSLIGPDRMMVFFISSRVTLNETLTL